MFQGQILANLKALESDWYAQNYMGRSAKVNYSLDSDNIPSLHLLLGVFLLSVSTLDSSHMQYLLFD